ncbi:MAG: hypothetical protein M1608_09480 [Candidatus Omnitrophica bacterium]|nr:hypothetical protein [Candidatus Omnitrophota bacterium]
MKTHFFSHRTPQCNCRSGFSSVRNSGGLIIWLLCQCVSSVVADQDPPGCAGSGLGIALFVDKTQAHVGDTLKYSALVYDYPFPACKASEVQAWVVTPDGVTNQIKLVRTVLNPGVSDYYENIATYVVRAQDVVGGVVKGKAVDIAKIHQNVTLSDGEAEQTVNTVIVTPCIDITAACNDGVGEDGQITFSGTVHNCGDIALGGVTVTNTVDGVSRRVFGPVSLDVGQTKTFSGSYRPANPCNPSAAVYVAAGSDTISPSKTVTASATATCALSLTPGIAIAQSCPTSPEPGGDEFIYGGVVTNTGNTILTNVVVVSDQPAPGTVIYTRTSLEPTGVVKFTGRFTAPTNACSVTVSLSVTASSQCGNLVSANSSSTCPLETTPAIVVTQNCPSNPTAPGEALNYSGTVKNSGDITLREITVTSSNPNAVVFTLDRLDPGAVASFTGSFSTPLDACSVTNRLTANARDICLNQAVSNSVTTVCNLTTAPAIAITQNCPSSAPAFGGTLTYSGTVQNTGNITLLNIKVVSERPSNTLVFQVPSLPPGAATNFTASYTVPANLNACSITNTLKVTGSDKCTGGQVSSTVTSVCLVQSSPKIHIVANCPTTPVAPGATLTYNGTVSNTGDVTLTGVTVTADQPAGGTTVLTVNSLAPGASSSFTGSYTAPLDTCSSTVTLTAQAADACAGTTVKDSVTQTCPLTTAPSLAVSLECPGTTTAPGKSLVFSGTITNTGNITLTNVTVTINQPSLNTPVFGPVSLAPGASMPFTGSFMVPTNLNNCTISSTVTARGYNQCNGSQVTASDTSICPVATSPAILLTTQCPPAPTPQGSLLTFSGTVKNVGNITLTNVIIVNNRPTNNTPVAKFALLLPNESTNFTGSFVVPVNCCEIVSTLTVTGIDLCGTSNVVDTATMICPVQYSPGVRISRSCPTEPVMPGDELRFTGAVTNTGNITLTGVTVVSGFLGPGKPLLGPIDLAPGETLPYTGSFVVPADFCGVDTTVVTGQSICGNQVTDTITSTCLVQTTPGIAVVNLPTGPMVSCSSKTGHGSVANTGNVSLTNVLVYCSQPANNTLVFGPITLASGAVTNFDYTYTAPKDCNCCEISVTLTATGRGKCDGRQVSNSSTIVVPVQTSPNISVALDCVNALSGNSLVSGTVQNTGDIALSNVVVVANLPAAGTVVAGPINLAIGESQFFVADLQSNDPAILQSFSVVATGNSVCGGGQVSASASCAKSPPGPLTITHGANQSVTLSWPAVAGVSYRIEYKTSLSDAAWQALGADLKAGSSDVTMTKSDSNATGAKFYRLRVVQ